MAYVGVLCDYYRTKSNNNGYGYTGSITGDFDWNEVQVGAEAGFPFVQSTHRCSEMGRWWVLWNEVQVGCPGRVP